MSKLRIRPLGELRDEMRAVARGERPPPPPAPPSTLTREMALEEGRYILEALAGSPATYKELVERFGKQRWEVARTLQRLQCLKRVKLTRIAGDIRAEIQS